MKIDLMEFKLKTPPTYFYIESCKEEDEERTLVSCPLAAQGKYNPLYSVEAEATIQEVIDVLLDVGTLHYVLEDLCVVKDPNEDLEKFDSSDWELWFENKVYLPLFRADLL